MKNHPNNKLNRLLGKALCGILTASLMASALTLPACAKTNKTPQPSEKDLRMEAQRAMPVDTNEVLNWPVGPIVTAESAILMEADTGTILYSKNIHQQEYPASCTKILTTLIASERCSMEETVTFSHDAVFDTPRDSNHIAMDVGNTLSMKDCINAILIRSANECSFAVAEHITGTNWQDFAEIMNQRAAELGCVDSHFVNPNGLPDDEHYTSAYDLAMIGRAFFANEMLCNTTLTKMLILQKPSGEYRDVNAMEIIPGKKNAYEYLIGCKTGYTNAARSCLVSAAEKDGMKLICVVMKDEAPYQYEDTIALFDYGFANFEKVNVSQSETKYNIESSGSFYSNNDIFGTSKPILSLNPNDCIILPKTVVFDDVDSVISYETDNIDEAALISYSYHGVPIGTASVDLATLSKKDQYSFDTGLDMAPMEEEPTNNRHDVSFIFINIMKVIGALIALVVLILLGFLLKIFLNNYEVGIRSDSTRREWRRAQRQKRASSLARRRNGYGKPMETTSLKAARKAQIKEAKRRMRENRRKRR